MAFSIREITIHLMGCKGGSMGPCHPASPTPLRPEVCKPRTDPEGAKTRPEDDKNPEGKKERSLALLQARLRETLAPPPA
jgi:hypothetical protein